MSESEAPVRLCCGQPHYGVVCPDGLVMCCICYTRCTLDELFREADGFSDICTACGLHEEEVTRAKATT